MNPVHAVFFGEDLSFARLVRHAMEGFVDTREYLSFLDSHEAAAFFKSLMHDENRSAASDLQLIVIDARFPEAEGLKVLQQVRSQSDLQRVPVVVFTYSQDQNDMQYAYDLGANCVVRKPFDFDKLLDTIERTCASWFATDATNRTTKTRGVFPTMVS